MLIASPIKNVVSTQPFGVTLDWSWQHKQLLLTTAEKVKREECYSEMWDFTANDLKHCRIVKMSVQQLMFGEFVSVDNVMVDYPRSLLEFDFSKNHVGSVSLVMKMVPTISQRKDSVMKTNDLLPIQYRLQMQVSIVGVGFNCHRNIVSTLVTTNVFSIENLIVVGNKYPVVGLDISKNIDQQYQKSLLQSLEEEKTLNLEKDRIVQKRRKYQQRLQRTLRQKANKEISQISREMNRFSDSSFDYPLENVSKHETVGQKRHYQFHCNETLAKEGMNETGNTLPTIHSIHSMPPSLDALMETPNGLHRATLSNDLPSSFISTDTLFQCMPPSVQESILEETLGFNRLKTELRYPFIDTQELLRTIIY